MKNTKKIISSTLLTLTLLASGVQNNASAILEEPSTPLLLKNSITNKSPNNNSNNLHDTITQSSFLMDFDNSQDIATISNIHNDTSSLNKQQKITDKDLKNCLKAAIKAWTIAEKQITSQNWKNTSDLFKKVAEYFYDFYDCHDNEYSQQCTSLSLIAKACAHVLDAKYNLEANDYQVLEEYLKDEKAVFDVFSTDKKVSDLFLAKKAFINAEFAWKKAKKNSSILNWGQAMSLYNKATKLNQKIKNKSFDFYYCNARFLHSLSNDTYLIKLDVNCETTTDWTTLSNLFYEAAQNYKKAYKLCKHKTDVHFSNGILKDIAHAQVQSAKAFFNSITISSKNSDKTEEALKRFKMAAKQCKIAGEKKLENECNVQIKNISKEISATDASLYT